MAISNTINDKYKKNMTSKTLNKKSQKSGVY